MSCTGYPTAQDAKDFKSNADTIKQVVTSPNEFTDPAIDGKKKLTLQGFEDRGDEAISDFESEANDAINNLGAESAVEYAAGILLERRTQRVSRQEAGVDGFIIYAPIPSELPFTTTGTWAGDDQLKFYAVAGTYSSFDPKVITTVAGQLTYTVPGGYDPNNIIVLYDNGYQAPGSYTATDSTTITLNPVVPSDIRDGRSLVILAIQFGANAITGPAGPAGDAAIVEYSVDNVNWSAIPTNPTNYLRWSTDGGATFQPGYFARGDTGDQYFYDEITAAGTTPLLRAARESRRELNGGTKTLQIDVSLYSQGDTEWIRKIEEAGDLKVQFLNGSVLFEGIPQTEIDVIASTADLRFTFNGTDFLLGV